MNCLGCGKETENPKFCSRSCSAIYNNLKRFPHVKEPTYGKCRICDKSTKNKRLSSRCKHCHDNIRKLGFYRRYKTIRISDVIRKQKTVKYQEVRNIAKTLWRYLNMPRYCECCGYSKHYELCHFIPISKHSIDTQVKDVNALSNLVALCPNCHWELDHDLMNNLDKIKITKILSNR